MAQPGELVTTNNQLSTFVNVLKGGLNVLYLEGALRVETEVSPPRAGCLAATSRSITCGSTRRDPQSRPADFAERFRPGKYDVYILGDVDSTAFRGRRTGPGWPAVSRGAGLIMLGGFHSFGPGGYGDTPLADVLPVGMDRFERQQPDEPLRTDLHLPGPLQMRPTAAGPQHFALMLAGSRRGERGAVGEAAAVGRRQQVPRTGPGGGRAGRRRAGQAAAGRAELRRRAGDGLCRRFHLALVDARLRSGPQAVLAADRALAGQEGPGPGGQRLGPPGPSAGLPPASGSISPSAPTPPRGEPVADAEFKAEIVSARRHPPRHCRWCVRRNRCRLVPDTHVRRRLRRRGDGQAKDQPLGTARARFLVFRRT